MRSMSRCALCPSVWGRGMRAIHGAQAYPRDEEEHEMAVEEGEMTKEEGEKDEKGGLEVLEEDLLSSSPPIITSSPSSPSSSSFSHFSSASFTFSPAATWGNDNDTDLRGVSFGAFALE